MSGLEKALFNLKVTNYEISTAESVANTMLPPQFTAKQLNRQAAKAGKDEQTERAKLKKVRSSSAIQNTITIARVIFDKTNALYVLLGYSARPRRHRQDLRPECDPQAEREAQLATAGLTTRRCQLARADCCDDAQCYGQYDECGQGHGYCDEEHGFGKGKAIVHAEAYAPA